MGKTVAELAELAYQFALGGMDLIKDDHGLTNQPFCPYEQRVAACAEAVQRANQQTGKHCLYVPNVTSPANQIWKRVEYAKRNGGRCLIDSPWLNWF